MYYHPRMFDSAHRERTLAAMHALVAVWLDGVVRQQQAHAEAVSRFCARQVEGLQRVTEAKDTAHLAAGLLWCAAPEPQSVAELSARLAGIVVDTHRKLGEVVAAHSDDVARSMFEPGATLETPQKRTANGSRPRQRRVAA